MSSKQSYMDKNGNMRSSYRQDSVLVEGVAILNTICLSCSGKHEYTIRLKKAIKLIGTQWKKGIACPECKSFSDEQRAKQ